MSFISELLAEILAIIVSVSGSVWLGFWLFHKKRQDQYVNEMLIDAYLCIEKAFSRDYDCNSLYRSKEKDWQLALEEALAKMQLLAPKSLADLVREYIKGLDKLCFDREKCQNEY